MYCKAIILTIVAFLFCSNFANTQSCEQTINSTVISDTEKRLIVHVSDLLSNDLSSSTQGICGVNIKFNHSSVEVMRIDLVSPAGTTVNLIGPATVNGSNTQFINWDVAFRPCGFPVSPDENFDDQWNNNNDWAGFSNYEGSYFPANGCLESFDTGTANGNWALIVEDLGSPANGLIESFELIFCDPAGLDCAVCEYTISDYNNDGKIICEGDASQTFDFSNEVQYESSNTDNEEVLLLIQNDLILDQGNTLNTNTLAPGTYQICALISDEGDYNDIENQTTLSGLRESIIQENLCALVSQQCKSITIDEIEEENVITDALCQNELFDFNGTAYQVPLDTVIYNYSNGDNGACESINTINIEEIVVLAEIADVFEEISETNEIVALSASSVSTNGSDVSYAWTTENGNYAGATNGPTTIVDQEGIYYLTITKQNCSDTDTIEIFRSPASGDEVILTTGDGFCIADTVQIFVETTLSIDTYNWSGPALVDANAWSPLVYQPGTYTLTINSPDEEEAVVTSIEVLAEQVPNFSLSTTNDLITCVDIMGNLSTSLNNPNQYTYEWLDEDGNILGQISNLDINAGGDYTVIVTNNSGCTNEASIFVAEDITPHSVDIVVDDLDCQENGQFFLTGDAPIKSVKWTGPPYAVFNETDQNPIISAVGKYTAKVTFEDECIVVKSVDMDYDPVVPDFELDAPTITCDQRDIPLNIEPNPNYEYRWKRTNGGWTTTTEMEPSTNKGGDYSVTVTDEDGCDAVYYFKVRVDTVGALFMIESNDIDCINESAVLDYGFEENGFRDFSWSGPGIDATNEDLAHPTVTEGGVYTISGVTDLNGCDFSQSIEIQKDLEEIAITNDSTIFTITCKRAKAKLIAKTDREGDEYRWTQNGILKGTNDTIRSTQKGTYRLLVTGSNGCTDEGVYFVEEDKAPPIVSDLSLPTIDCNQDMAQVEVELTDNLGAEDFTFVWTDLNNDTLSIQDLSFTTSESGAYIIHSTNDLNGCISLDTINVIEDYTLPDFEIAADTLTCANLNPSVFLIGNTNDLSIQWDTYEGIIEDELMITTSAEDTVFLVSAGLNGCERLDTIAIVADTVYTSLDFDYTETEACEIINLPLQVDASIGNENTSFSWWSNTGEISGDNTSPDVIVNGDGFYFVVAENLDNSCITYDSIFIDAVGSIDGALIDQSNPFCNNDPTGTINVQDVDGGSGNYEYALNGSNDFQASPNFDELTSGAYTLNIIDDTGCSLDTIVMLDAGNTIEVETIETIEVNEGESISIFADADYSGNTITYEWISEYITSCGDCDEVELTPFSNETVIVYVTDENGCTDFSEIRIFVNEKSDVFLPNAFSPLASEAVNQVLQPWFAPFVDNVNDFSVYDRWGNQVFNASNIDPSSETILWDGTYNGQNLPSGVYVILVDYTKGSGQRVTITQDITLIR